MNVNEVLANRALEILGRPRGEYTEVSPNDHVNRGQSTNDTFPSAAQVAVLLSLGRLRPAVLTLSESLRRKGEEFAALPKAGRTHLKDAMPVTLGAEFRAYASALEHVLEALPPVEAALAEIPLGGSAVGSGINTSPGFRAKAVAEYARLTGLPLRPSRDPFESMQSRWPLGSASGWLRTLASELVRIANDLRLLSSGPATGFDEIRLPEIQPGFVDHAGEGEPVRRGVPRHGRLPRHRGGPRHLAGGPGRPARDQRDDAARGVRGPLLLGDPRELPPGLRADVRRRDRRPHRGARPLPPRSTAVATVLTPKFGYLKVAELIHESSRTGRSVKELLVAQKLLTADEVDAILGPAALLAMTRPVV